MVEEGEEGEELEAENVIFFILNLVFIIMMLIFVARTGSGASIYEEIYAKKIALMIDEAKAGTTIEIDIAKLIEVAKKNDAQAKFNIDEENKKVSVYLAQGGGFSFNYFSSYKIYPLVNYETKKLKIGVQNE